ncbi:MAG: DNA cytosine methyltransferase [Thermodesulfobacteriota bacterium]
MRVLNLYAGIGGNRKLWEDVEVTAVENNPEIAKIYKDFFPDDEVIVADAHQYLLDNFKEFDFIWSSPPCPTHSVCSHFLKGQGIIRYPDMNLYQEIILLKHFFNGKYCVENVISYYKPLIHPQEVGRHYFWANFYISHIDIEYDIGTMNRNASKDSQRKAIIRETQIPELIDLHGLKDFKLKNKRQVLRNCVLPKVGLHVFNESKKGVYSELFGQANIEMVYTDDVEAKS